MGIQDRPYVGTWKLNNKTLVRHAPDAIVLVNGFTEFASCVSCNKKINLQQYITSVSCDVSKDPITSASVSISVPQHAKDVFDRDGNFLIKNGMEVIILLKGYFPTKNYAGKGITDIDGFDPDDVSVYPYYQVFRGVSTSVSHSYDGGFYSATISCANLLHFWQNLKVSVNGAAFAKRPANSGNQIHLSGHKFTSANPYSIIYTLVKVGFGAAFGVEFKFAQATNISAKSDTDGQEQFAHAAEWWEKRWQESAGRLRMYGMDGRLFNAFEQAYLGRWIGSSDNFSKQVTTVMEALKDTGSYDLQGSSAVKARLRRLGYNRMATNAGVYSTQNNKGSVITEDVLKMQAFVYDISAQGSVNMFETEYASKLDIVNQVLEVTGFEFFQDADGDFVFKPPMYNLDTRQDPVYVIKDRDLISIEESQAEPNATIIKGTGSHWGNIDTGIDGWAGVGATYIDYRLVAQYGYREESFDTKYFTSKQAIFLSCINRLDLANIGTTSGSIEIPLRPELKPGYPVYVESKDCFYYVESVSHSFSYAGGGTTSISWVGKRSKWCPPVKSRSDSKLPTIEDVRLDSPGEYPPQPILMYPSNPDSITPPRMVGFPNVIMALDINKLNYETVDVDKSKVSPESFIELVLASGLVYRDVFDKDVFYLSKSSEEQIPIHLEAFKTEYTQQRDADQVSDTQLGESVAYLIQQIDLRYGGVADIEDAGNLINYISLQSSLKNTFDPGNNLTGRYRYYSCSHPDPIHQAPYNLIVDQDSDTPIEVEDSGHGTDSIIPTVLQFRNRNDGLGMELVEKSVSEIRGVKVLSLVNDADGSNSQKRVVSTADIYAITFGPHLQRKKVKLTKVDPRSSNISNFKISKRSVSEGITDLLYQHAMTIPSNELLQDRFIDMVFEVEYALENFQNQLGVENTSKVQDGYNNFQQAYYDDSLNYTVIELGLDNTKCTKKSASNITSWTMTWLNAVINEGVKKLKQNSDLYEDFMTYRAQLFNNLFGPGTITDPLEGVFYIYVEDTKSIEHYTPVFPVSDQSGYTVIGTLPYGRGLTIDTYSKLFQSEKSEGESIIEGQGVQTSDMAAVENFLIGYAASNNISDLLTEYEDSEYKAILASFDVGSEEELMEKIETLDAGGDISPKLRIRNIPVTSYFRGQRVLGNVGASQLANLDFDEGICVCKGSDGAFFLQAFNQQLETLYGDESVQEFLKEEALAKTQGWVESKKAMSGEDNTVFESSVDNTNIQALLGGFQSTVNQGQQEVQNLQQIITNIDNVFGEDE